MIGAPRFNSGLTRYQQNNDGAYETGSDGDRSATLAPLVSVAFLLLSSGRLFRLCPCVGYRARLPVISLFVTMFL